jgi:hypothetical protein
MFWPPALLNLTSGISLDAETVARDGLAMRDDYQEVERAVKRHPERFKGLDMSFHAFEVAVAWVSSRAFYVDDFHGVIFMDSLLSPSTPLP